ncbi:MAG: IS5 family transposase [Flavobacteriaceae bacterium]
MKRYKRHRDYGFFDQDLRLNKLSQLGDPLEKFKAGIDFEQFRAILEDNLSKQPKGKGGRPPYDYVLLFKILILQRFYNLSDDQMEYQINDRMSFMRFLALSIADDIPDSKTVWNFRERLVDLDLTESLFGLFLRSLEQLGLVVNEGKIVDASFVEAPRQRNNKAENKQIKSGEVPESFKDNPHKLSQKDTDARWTKKNNTSYFGYKNHIKTDTKSKLITKYVVTDASVHDSQTTETLLDKEKDAGQDFHADSAYTGQEQEKIIAAAGMANKACEKGYKNRPLTDGKRPPTRKSQGCVPG